MGHPKHGEELVESDQTEADQLELQLNPEVLDLSGQEERQQAAPGGPPGEAGMDFSEELVADEEARNPPAAAPPASRSGGARPASASR